MIVSFMSTKSVLTSEHAVLAPPVTLFGSQALDTNPTDVNQNIHASPQTTVQTVNNARQHSFKRISEQDNANPNIKYKKLRSGSSKKVKVVAPRDYPGESHSKHTGGSRQQTLSERVEIAVLCLPRTVSLHCCQTSHCVTSAH